MQNGDDIVLSGGGRVAVATDELFATMAELRRFAGHAAATGARVASLPQAPVQPFLEGEGRGGGYPPTSPTSAASAAGDTDQAARALRTAAERADELAATLQWAAESYGELERRAIRLSRAAEGWVAERAGAWLPTLLIPLLPVASAAAIGLLLGMLLPAPSAAPPGPATSPARPATRPSHGAEESRQARLLTDPRVVALLRSLVLGSDDFGAGVLRAPPGSAAVLGENGADIVGLRGTAGVLVAVATRFGVAREGGVRVRESGRATVAAAPEGFRDRAARVPTGRSQIRIERYSSSGRPDRFEVFLGGTRAARLVGGDEPWDLTSGLHAAADRSPASLRATEEAMRRSGITADSEVVFTGYSQGGLLATQLAASGDWNTRGLVTFGAPVGAIALPDSFPAVQVEHTDDIVPALGGDRTDHEPLVVRREAFAGRAVPPGIAVPAHDLGEYRSTAELLDGARSPAVTHASARLNAIGSGAERIQVSFYRADRMPDGN